MIVFSYLDFNEGCKGKAKMERNVNSGMQKVIVPLPP